MNRVGPENISASQVNEVFPTEGLVDFARSTFSHVSRIYPGSVTGQASGLTLALRSRGIGDHASDLLSSLMYSPEQIAAIRLSGEEAHKAAGRGFVPLSFERVLEIVPVVFTYAERMRLIDSEVLIEIQGLHGVAYKTGPKVFSPEDRLKSLVLGMLHDRKLPPIDFETKTIAQVWPIATLMERLSLPTGNERSEVKENG